MENYAGNNSISQKKIRNINTTKFYHLIMEGTVGVMVIIRDSHSRDSGSIPGRCKIIFFSSKFIFTNFIFYV